MGGLRRWYPGWILVAILLAPAGFAQDRFAGVMGGVSTLSADAVNQGTPPQATSSYKPENGATVVGYLGKHFTDYFSLQVSYSWNQNALTLAGGNFVNGTSYSAPFTAKMYTYAFEGMAYFRKRDSLLRPYLSAGPTVSHLWGDPNGASSSLHSGVGPAVQVPQKFHKVKVGLRVAVGIDWRISKRVSLRYSFSETIQQNPISEILQPPAQRRLANFQNLWGVHFHF